ncbi:MAG TPA: hypothetical protein VMJ75_13190 [Candidatus Acidoferrales bacterium]|nr:hypothetical protein [Candidatus Acidoferrales bacterium]
MISCPTCEIALPNGTRRCPMCQRNLAVPVRLIGGAAVLLLVLLLFGFLRYSGRIKNKVDALAVTPPDVLAATQTLVAGSPMVKNPTGFSSLSQTSLEHWDGRRWRVSGYFDSRTEAGAAMRTLYFAVVQYNGRTWDLEDLQLQNVEVSPAGTGRK